MLTTRECAAIAVERFLTYQLESVVQNEGRWYVLEGTQRCELRISLGVVVDAWGSFASAGEGLGDGSSVDAVARLLGVYLFEAVATMSEDTRVLTLTGVGFLPDEAS